LSDSESERSTDDEATAKSKAIHARDHLKKEQEKKAKKAAAQMKKQQAKEKAAALVLLAARNNVQAKTAAAATNTATSKSGHKELEPWQKYDTISVLVTY
jgi:hypothetical protein